VRLTGVSVTTGGMTWTATFDENPGGGRAYAAASAAGRLSPVLEIDQPSSWADSSNGADLIVIVHPDLATAAQSLVDHRVAAGLRVAKVEITDVYDEFNGGEVHPRAIQDLISYAYHNWQPPAPSMVLLVGDGSYDYKDNLGLSDVSLIPAYLYDVTSFGESPDENYYVRVDGSDSLPDLAIGRLPARDATELTTMINRILDYETVPPLADLNDEVLLVSDDDVVQFEVTNNSLATNFIPPGVLRRKAYRSQHSVSETRAEIEAGFNDGPLLVNYFGHGHSSRWGYEQFWHNSYIDDLTNVGLEPFLTSLNCINGHFTLVGDQYAMSEVFLNHSNGGVVGSWSPAALGNIPDYDALIHRLYENIYYEHDVVMGLSAYEALLEAYLEDGVLERNLRDLVFLGDPALHLQLDSDRDGLLDEDEVDLGSGVRDADSDDDGLADGDEPSPGGDADGDGTTNLLDPDADADGLPDGLEAGMSAPTSGTDVSAGWFIADANPGTTTDPADVDSDGGGVADGAEDRDRDGQVDTRETDPNNPADDDPTGCIPTPLPAVEPVFLARLGDDVRIYWSDYADTYPCVLYRIYGARDQGAPKDNFEPWDLLAVTPEPFWNHVDAARDGSDWDYLVVTWTLAHGEGPMNHYDR
jgi:hypothetical protein